MSKTKVVKTAAEFETAVGHPPEMDDLERVNCDQAGTMGHQSCGWCDTHNKPNFICGCGMRARAPKPLYVVLTAHESSLTTAEAYTEFLTEDGRRGSEPCDVEETKRRLLASWGQDLEFEVI